MCVFVDGREGVCMHAHICVGICVDNRKFEFAFKSMRLFRLQTVWVNLSQLKTLVVLSFLSSFCPGQRFVHHLAFAAKLLSQVSVSHKLFPSLSQALLSQFLHKLSVPL